MSTLSRRNLFGLTAGAVVTAGLSACAGSGGSSSALSSTFEVRSTIRSASSTTMTR